MPELEDVMQQLKLKFASALISLLVFAVPGAIVAQNPDLSQNPTPDQATVPSQDQGQYQDQDSNGPLLSDGTRGSAQDDQGQYDQGQSNQGQSNQGQYGQNDQNDRPPMSELPPKPSPNGPAMQGPNMQGPPPGPNGPGGPYPGGPNSDQGNPNQNSSNNGVARLSLIHGDVSTRRGDSGEWSAAQLNAPLMAGDKVSTGDASRTEIQLDYANILRLAEHTQANITNLTPKQIQIQLGHGMANYTVLRNSDADAEIDTPNVAIRTERREASFRILVTADDNTEVLVRRGEVEITTPQGGTRVGANQFITIKGNGDQTQYRIGDAPARDDWDQWNTDRDRMINDSASRRRTNDYYTGSQDLDANGNWQNVPDYGQAWFPNVAPGWVPYSAGNWVWQPYYGWTWVSYEPWGWAPYHYGRWFMYNGAWGWWPGPTYPYYRPVWAPAYVSFFGFGGGVGIGVGFGWGSIGWFPIGPCDFFHPWWGAWGGHFGYTGWYGWNHGGFAPLHAGNRFSNVWAAQHDANFRGATSVAANRFGQGRTTFSPVGHEALQNAHFATGNLPVTPTRASLSASGRPAAPSTTVNRGGNSFYSSRGITSATNGRSFNSFDHEQAQVNNAMRQNGVSPANGNQHGFENANNGARTGESSFHNDNARSGNVNSNAGNNEGARSFGQSENSRSTTDTRGNSNWGSVPRPGNSVSSEGGREGGGASNGSSGGWQKFTPMQPRSTAEQPGRSFSENGGGAENRGINGSNGSPSRSYGSSGYGSEGRSYGSSPYGGGSRPSLSMRQPIVTPRSSGGYGGYPGYGGRAPGYSAPSYGGGRAPSYSGGGRAPSYGGGGHSAPASHGGGAPHGGGGSHGGGSHGGGGHHR
jgi:hypothetical protein